MIWLEELVLFETYVMILPENMSHFAHMKRLYVQKSLIAELPLSLFDLTNFENICLDKNELNGVWKKLLTKFAKRFDKGKVIF